MRSKTFASRIEHTERNRRRAAALGAEQKWTGSARPFESHAGPPPGPPGGVRQPDTLTPIEAMSLIYEWKQKLR
ncbi:hypothetical protein [Dysosmobacter sp. Phy]